MEKHSLVSWSLIFLCLLGIFSHLLVEATREVRLLGDVRLGMETSNSRLAANRGQITAGGYDGGVGYGGDGGKGEGVGSGYGGGMGQGGSFGSGTGSSTPGVGPGGGLGSSAGGSTPGVVPGGGFGSGTGRSTPGVSPGGGFGFGGVVGSGFEPGSGCCGNGGGNGLGKGSGSGSGSGYGSGGGVGGGAGGGTGGGGYGPGAIHVSSSRAWSLDKSPGLKRGIFRNPVLFHQAPIKN